MYSENVNDDTVVDKEHCPDCGSTDNLIRYADGHAHCFTPGCGRHEPPTNGYSKMSTTSKPKKDWNITEGEYKALPARKISEETCQKFGYKVGKFKGKTAQIAPAYEGNQLVAQKFRLKNKDFIWQGEPKRAGLFGQQVWRDGGKRLVITEGELDAMSVSQAQGNKWPVVSVFNGAQGAKKDIAKVYEWVDKFETIVLCFDNDDAGQAVVEEIVTMFRPGKVKVATLPLKDANAMILAGREKELISCLWEAKDFHPPSIASVMDDFEIAIKRPEAGIPWPWPSLTALTYGIHRRKCYYLGAGVGIGKTNWAMELQSWLVNNHNLPVGVIMLEQGARRTLQTIAGKFTGIPFYKPDAEYTDEQLEKAIKDLDGKVYRYRHEIYGSDWDDIVPAIRGMVHYAGVRDIFVDNLTVLVAHLTASEANEEINRIAKEISELVHELDITIYGFSHLNPPKQGNSHERGGHVNEAQFTGSRGLMRFGDYLFGLERNKDPELSQMERNVSHFVLLKDREYGNVGRFPIYYDPEHDSYREPPEGFLDFLNDDDEEETDKDYSEDF